VASVNMDGTSGQNGELTFVWDLWQYSDELHVAASLAGGHSMVHRSEVGTVYLQIPLTIFGDSLSYMESSNTHTMMMVA